VSSENEIRLKGTEIKKVPHLNALVCGATNAGKTYFLLSYVRSQKKRMVIINADIEENFVRNLNMLTPEQRKRVIQPHKENISGLQMGNVVSIKKVVGEILDGPIQKLIQSEQIELIAVDGVETILSVYEDWLFKSRRIENPTPFDFGRARDLFEREFLLPLLRQPCHFLASSNYSPLYPDNAGQFAEPVKINIGGRMINAHQPKLPARFWKHFTTIIELRQINPQRAKDVDAFFIKSKEHIGLFSYSRLPKASKMGLEYEDYLKYVREHFK